MCATGTLFSLLSTLGPQVWLLPLAGLSLGWSLYLRRRGVVGGALHFVGPAAVTTCALGLAGLVSLGAGGADPAAAASVAGSVYAGLAWGGGLVAASLAATAALTRGPTREGAALMGAAAALTLPSLLAWRSLMGAVASEDVAGQLAAAGRAPEPGLLLAAALLGLAALRLGAPSLRGEGRRAVWTRRLAALGALALAGAGAAFSQGDALARARIAAALDPATTDAAPTAPLSDVGGLRHWIPGTTAAAADTPVRALLPPGTAVAASRLSLALAIEGAAAPPELRWLAGRSLEVSILPEGYAERYGGPVLSLAADADVQQLVDLCLALYPEAGRCAIALPGR